MSKQIADILLQYFPENYIGTIVEAGGGHPVDLSISAHFRDLGWKIITIEPNPDFCEEYRKKNIDVLEYAVCDEDKGVVRFKISPNAVSCSALEIRYVNQKKGMGWTDEQFQTINVEAFTLNTILKKHHPEVRHIDILIVDTEGWELEVLSGLDFEKYNPDVMCIENFQNSELYEPYMQQKGYVLSQRFEHDEFYIKLK